MSLLCNSSFCRHSSTKTQFPDDLANTFINTQRFYVWQSCSFPPPLSGERILMIFIQEIRVRWRFLCDGFSVLPHSAMLLADRPFGFSLPALALYVMCKVLGLVLRNACLHHFYGSWCSLTGFQTTQMVNTIHTVLLRKYARWPPPPYTQMFAGPHTENLENKQISSSLKQLSLVKLCSQNTVFTIARE